MPVHSKLVEALSEVSGYIALDLKKVHELVGDLRDINLYYLKMEIPDPPDIAASDSSGILKSYSMATVFAIQAAALRASVRNPSSSRLVVDADAGYYLPTPRASEVVTDELLRRVLQYVSRMLELSSLTEVSEGAGAALLDGSIFSFLWYSKFPEIPRDLRFSKQKPRRLRDMWRGIVSKLVDLLRSGTPPIFIAKTIRRSYYVSKLLSDEGLSKLNAHINDLVLIHSMIAYGRLPRGVYILEPVYISSVDEMPRPLNTLDQEDVTYLEPLVPITVTYASFSPTALPYQITIPGRWSANELVELLSYLYPYSYSGYPDPLKLAHRLSKLGNKEVGYLLSRLGLLSLPTGRELLGEVG